MQNFIDNLNNLIISVDNVIKQHQTTELLNSITKVKDVIDIFDKSHSGSWFGYHSRIYYKNFNKPPVRHPFSIVWGLDGGVFNEGTIGPWIEYDYDFVIEQIKIKSGFDEYNKIREYCFEIENNFSKLKQEFLSILSLIKREYTDDYINKLESDVDNIKFFSISMIANTLIPKRKVLSRDQKAMLDGAKTPPHMTLSIDILSYEIGIKNCKDFIAIIENIIKHLLKIPSLNTNKNKTNIVNSNSIIKGNNMNTIRLFISHSSEDHEIIENLIEVLQSSLKDLKDSDIRCISVEGYEFKPGEDFLKMIKEESGTCEYILSVFSNNSLSSSMVLFECGIGWFLDKVIPVIIDKDIDYANLPTPYQTKITKKIFKKRDLLDIIDHLSKVLNLEKNLSSKIDKKVKTFIEKHFY